MAVDNPKVLITGAAGFVGYWLRRCLAEEHPYATVIATTASTGGRLRLDVTKVGEVRSMLIEHRPSAVVHLAAIASPQTAGNEPDVAWNINVEGTRILAGAIKELLPECRFVQVGSSEEYGHSFTLSTSPLNEDAALRPMSTYGLTKATADLVVGQMECQGLKAVRFRPFNHTGPGQSDQYVTSAFAKQIAAIAKGKAKPLVQVGNLSARRDFLDVRDVVRAYAIAAVGSEPPAGERVYNLATGDPQSIESILQFLIDLSGRAIDVCHDPSRVRPVDIPIASGTSDRAKSHWLWEPKYDFRQTLTDVFAHWMKTDA